MIAEKSKVGHGSLVVLEDGVPVPYYIEEKDWKNAVPEIDKSAFGKLQEALISHNL
eukprot:CAMPEP_0113847598 /NCGR_PEP_ID=MMETSP0372-20130328/1970_1 /TAXON_ID=340204 /ORGANISM="Lankesteria abbotti" /LENGTH=55 /DNA_ID=CAMNT_0000816907 /DNA_START=482 /DNA_END=649 /DNA_ORIENTATION=+ /assembly_acc=CAM_ASM_000359